LRIREATNATTKIRKSIWATAAALEAVPPNPNMARTIAIRKKVSAILSMVVTSFHLKGGSVQGVGCYGRPSSAGPGRIPMGADSPERLGNQVAERRRRVKQTGVDLVGPRPVSAGLLR
jgi:hypothetical protein